MRRCCRYCCKWESEVGSGDVRDQSFASLLEGNIIEGSYEDDSGDHDGVIFSPNAILPSPWPP
jgi:hypothetical protein